MRDAVGADDGEGARLSKCDKNWTAQLPSSTSVPSVAGSSGDILEL